MRNKGFTLIELLVVIAIIGLLSSVVLASLNSARNKGGDASVQSNLGNIRAQAAMYYDTNSNYGSGSPTALPTTATACCTGVNCTAGLGFVGAADGVAAKMIAGAQSAGGGGAGSALCAFDATTLAQKYAVWVPLKTAVTGGCTVSGNCWCVDDSGISGKTYTTIAGGYCH